MPQFTLQDLKKLIDNGELKNSAIADAIYRQVVQLINSTYTQIAYKFAKTKLINNRFLPKKVRSDIDSLLSTMNKNIEDVIKKGVLQSWHLAEEKNASIETSVSGSGTKPPARTILTVPASPDYNMISTKFGGGSASAAKEFIEGNTTNFSVSERVWKQSPYFKKYITDTLTDTIKNGVSARESAKQLMNAEYRPKDAQDPRGQGQGVYKDPKKNAERLTRTTINESYRTADYYRINQPSFWFVTGIEVHLAHAQRKYDMCDSLQGKYPKDFKFTGWHIQCRCYQASIVVSSEIQQQMIEYKLGKRPNPPTVKYITDIPAKATAWVNKNEERIDGWATKPDFLYDNADYFD